MYYAVVEFLAPAGNQMTILANDEDHARKLLAEMHANVKDFKIVDIHDMDDNPELKAVIEASQAQTPQTDGGSSPPPTLN